MRDIKKLKQQAETLYQKLESCDVCPRKCGVNRLNGETGFCRSGLLPRASSWNLHYGEEPPVSGTSGSGTIFLSYCTFRCQFCQNWPISQLGNGTDLTIEELASKMITLQKRGAHNINFVTPTQFFPQIARALVIAFEKGLTIPILVNDNGYENLETLRLLEGFIDIYLPDYKYTDDTLGNELSQVPDYKETAIAAIMEMKRQVGDLELDEHGLATRGLLIRHLILPGQVENSKEALTMIADKLGNPHISLMSQYFPAHKALHHGTISRKLDSWEFRAVSDYMDELGLDQGWKQEI